MWACLAAGVSCSPCQIFDVTVAGIVGWKIIRSVLLYFSYFLLPILQQSHSRSRLLATLRLHCTTIFAAFLLLEFF